MRTSALVAIAALALASSAAGAPGQGTAHSMNAARVAVKHQVAAMTGRKVWKLGLLACYTTAGRSATIWTCANQSVHATITYRQLATGWTPTVYVTCLVGVSASQTACQ